MTAAPTRNLVQAPRLAERREGRLLAALAIAIVGAMLLPIIVLVYRTFVPPAGSEVSGLEALRSVYSTTDNLVAIRNSIMLGLIAAIGSTAIAACLAWLFHKSDIPMRRLLEGLLLAGFALTPVLAATAWRTLLAPRAGLLNYWWSELGFGDQLLNIRSLEGTIFVQTLVFVPFAYLIVNGAIAGLTVDEEEAAEVHSVSTPRMLWSITLPSMSGSVITAGVLVFTFAIQSFSVPLLLAEPAGVSTIPSKMLLGFTTGSASLAEINALGSILLIFGCLSLVLLWRTQDARLANDRALAKSGRQSRAFRLGKLRWPVGLIALGYVVVSIVIPVLTLLTLSFMKYVSPRLEPDIFTVENYVRFFNDDTVHLAVRNSLTIGFIVATIGTLMAIPVAYMIVHKLPAHRIASLTSLIPLGMPSLILGFGLLYSVGVLSAHVPGFSNLTNTALLSGLLLLALFGVAVRIIVPTMMNLGADLDEAAKIAGAGIASRISLITVPLLFSPLISVWRTLFMLGIVELDVVVLNYQPDGITLSVLVLNKLSQELSADVFPLAILLLLLFAFVVVVSYAVEASLKGLFRLLALRQNRYQTLSERNSA